MKKYRREKKNKKPKITTQSLVLFGTNEKK